MRLEHIHWSPHHPIHWVKFHRTQLLPASKAGENPVPLAAPFVSVAPQEEAIAPLTPAATAQTLAKIGFEMAGVSAEHSTSLAAMQCQVYANPALNAAMMQLLDQPAYAQMMGTYMQSNPNLQPFAWMFQDPALCKACIDMSKTFMQALAQPSGTVDYSEQLQQLQLRGYRDEAANQAALRAANGDIQAAIQMLSHGSNS